MPESVDTPAPVSTAAGPRCTCLTMPSSAFSGSVGTAVSLTTRAIERNAERSASSMAASWKSMRVKFTAQNLDPHAGSSAPAIRQGALAPPCAARTTGNIVVHRVQLPPPRAAEPPLPHSALAPYWDERSVFHQLQLPPPTPPSAVAR